MIPGVDLLSLISVLGVFGVALLIFAESGLLIGFFLPGDSVLFTSGFLINNGVLHINIAIAIAIFFVAGVAGNSVGYWFGRKAGQRLFARDDARFFKKKYIDQAQAFYDAHGGESIILARFIPIVRTFAPIVAGIGEMSFKRFTVYNVIGGFLWTVGVTLLGFFLGKWFESMGIQIDDVLLPLIAAIIVISLLPPLLHVLLNKTRREALMTNLKHHFSSITNRKK